ncbi:MAG: PorV/PorQ family protein [Candidatus Marinimicrobia bacterium]|nr:PorV/PorQ family protein [Candidatus Neomarinimicrobiota bacterium]
MTVFLAIALGFIGAGLRAQEPYRVGTTAANFLEIGIGSDGNAMGEAYVSMVGNLSSVYWNPAGLAFINNNEVLFMYQPWVVDINNSFMAVSYTLPLAGTFALAFNQVSYGEMPVTTLESQEGTGELFTANDFSFSLTYSRKLAQWFAFGASAKYITSRIWHTAATAIAADLGVIVNTGFFSPSGKHENGLRIGMSISNYGSRMRYDGMDLLFPIDILPEEAGNYSAVKGQFNLQEWELPLIFRIGISVQPIVSRHQRLTLAVDALHPNNNAESVNVGAEYAIVMPGTGSFFLRGGYKSLFMRETEYGATFGAGFLLRFLGNYGIKVDYAFKPVGILGNTHSYTLGVTF